MKWGVAQEERRVGGFEGCTGYTMWAQSQQAVQGSRRPHGAVLAGGCGGAPRPVAPSLILTRCASRIDNGQARMGGISLQLHPSGSVTRNQSTDQSVPVLPSVR